MKKWFKKIGKEDILFAVFCMMTAVIFAAYRCVCGDFNAINGDFQNYNIFRRLLDGQVQYRDFTNYLGNGMVFINFPLIFVFKSFGASVFITYFTTSILYSLIIFVSLYTLLRDRKTTYMITSIISIAAFVVLYLGFYGKIYQLFYNFAIFETMVGSMRTTRAFLPFMLVGIFYIVKKILQKEALFFSVLNTNKALVAIYFILGFLTVWSNDYGYAGAACCFIIMIIIHLFGEKSSLPGRLIKDGISILCIVMGALTSIAIITRGNIMDYVSINAGILDYQWWYYCNDHSKYLTVADIFSDKKYLYLTVIFFAHAVNFLVKTIRRKITDDDVCRLFLHSTCYGASLIYVVGTGAHNYIPVETLTVILAAGFIVKMAKVSLAFVRRMTAVWESKGIVQIKSLFLDIIKMCSRNRIVIHVHIMLLLYCLAVNVIRTGVSYEDKEHIKGLDIYSTIGQGLNECAKDISDGAVFSTYASAIETINGVFQPSGIDYIIHVLGDRQRQQYMDDFRQGDYRYVSTPKNEYTCWEYWSSRVNWFFYRELYRNYAPVKETNYSVIWEKVSDEHTIKSDISIDWEYVSSSTCRIDVQLPEGVDSAYVDVTIKYNTSWTGDRLKKGGLRKILCVEDGGEQYNSYMANSCYYLRERSDGCEIPVYVRNGKGAAYISSYPLSCTELEVVEITANMVIKEPDYPLHLTNYKDTYPWISKNSVDETGMLLKFDNTEYNTTVLQDIGQIKANGEVGIVKDIWSEGSYIYVSLENPINREKFIYPNNIEVVKKKEASCDE